MDLLDPGSSARPRGQLRGLGRGAGVGCPSSRLRLCWSSCPATASGPCSETPRPPCSASLSLSSAPLHPAESQAVPHFESDHPPPPLMKSLPFQGHHPSTGPPGQLWARPRASSPLFLCAPTPKTLALAPPPAPGGQGPTPEAGTPVTCWAMPTLSPIRSGVGWGVDAVKVQPGKTPPPTRPPTARAS